MTTNDVSIIPITLNKRPLSDKQRIHSRSPSVNKSRREEFRLNRTMTAINRPSSKLPNARIKTSLYSSVLGYRPPEQNSKLERQSTTVNANTRLPVVYSLMTEHDQRQMSEFRRRQIYALNHYMRDLEQEQFRQFCKTNEINSDDTK